MKKLKKISLLILLIETVTLSTSTLHKLFNNSPNPFINPPNPIEIPDSTLPKHQTEMLTNALG
jgi:hypothetical protein